MADYWTKIYIEIIDDPKMATMPDRLWRRTVELFLLAKKFNQSGHLPDTKQLAWMLRMSTDDLDMDLRQIEHTGIIRSENGGWFVVNFEKRQAASTPKERMEQMRKREHKDQYYGNVTQQLRNVTQSTETETETETEVPKSTSEFLDTWKELFPEKPQPKPGTIRDKLKTRLKDIEFSKNWKEALVRASKTKILHSESWFNAQYILRNDDNCQKILDGWMDWKDEQKTGNVSQPEHRMTLEEVKRSISI